MKVNKFVWISVPALGLAAAYNFFLGASTPTEVVQQVNIKTEPLTISPTIATPNKPPHLIKAQPTTENNDLDGWVSQAVKLQMVEVSEAYAENIRYPKYSKPLHDTDWNLLNPRPFIPKLTPLDFNDDLSAGIVLPQYIVSRDENLPVNVEVKGAQISEVQPQHVSVYLSDHSETENRIDLTSASYSDGVFTYSGVLDKEMFSTLDNRESMIFSKITFDNNEQAIVSAVFKLVGTDATMTHLDDSYVDGAHLIIPANFDISKQGYYRVEANLFDKNSQKPISHLNSSFLLSNKENKGLLKVHASTLRSKGYAGPYQLTDFNITRGPSKPGDKTGYGTSKEDTFNVEGFDLNAYSHEEYEDPKNKQRLEFLQKMAGIQ